MKTRKLKYGELRKVLVEPSSAPCWCCTPGARHCSTNGGRVTFRYKDYAAAGRDKLLTLSAEEFLRRFLQHVLPKGFVKVRHYGLLANRQRGDTRPRAYRPEPLSGDPYC